MCGEEPNRERIPIVQRQLGLTGLEEGEQKTKEEREFDLFKASAAATHQFLLHFLWVPLSSPHPVGIRNFFQTKVASVTRWNKAKVLIYKRGEGVFMGL